MHNDGVVFGKAEFQCNLDLSLNPACGDSTKKCPKSVILTISM